MRTEVELFGGPEQIFGTRDLPAGRPRAAVVICPSAPVDAAVDAERTARLGRRLAEVGLAAQRFDYRGTGASDGDPAGLGFAGMVADARAALELVRERCRVDRVAVLGARVGALVAARVARPTADVPVVAWEPPPDPRSVLVRVAAASALAAGSAPEAIPGDVAQGSVTATEHGGPSPTGATPAPGTGTGTGSGGAGVTAAGAHGAGDATGAAPGPEPDDDGPATAAHLLDTPLAGDLFDATLVADLVAELGPRSRPLLVVQTAPGDGLHPDLRDLVGRARARGLAVDSAFVPCDGERDGLPVPAASAESLLSHTVTWLAAHLTLSDPSGTSTGVPVGPSAGDARPGDPREGRP